MKTLRPGTFIALAFIAHLGVLVFLIPPGRIFSDKPLYQYDYSSNYYFGVAGSRILAQNKAFEGYDPFFLGGYPFTPHSNTGGIFYMVWLAVTPFLPAPLSYNLLVFLLVLIFPAALLLGSRLLGLGAGQRNWMLGLGLGSFWLSIPGLFIAGGMPTFVAGTYLGFLGFCVLKSILDRLTTKRVILFWLLCGTAILVHPSAAMTWGLAGVLLVLLRLRRIPLKTWLVILAGLGIAFAFNITWYLPMRRYGWIMYQIKASGWKISPSDETFTSILLGACPLRFFWSIPALYVLIRKGGLKRYFPEYAAAGAFAFAAYVLPATGRFDPALVPQRFKFCMDLFLIVPAVEILAPWFSSPAAAMKKWFSRAVLALAIPAAIALSAPVMLPLTGEQPSYILPWDGRIDGFVQWIQNNTSNEARIMFEDSDYFDENGKSYKYYRGYPAGYISLNTGRSLIGGPVPLTPVRYNFFASFKDGKVFNTPIRKIPPEKLTEYFERYNIGWVLAWSKPALEYFWMYRDMVKLVGIYDKKFYLFKTGVEPGFIDGGSALVTWDYNRIKVRNLNRNSNVITLKFHYIEALKCEPGCKPEPVMFSWFEYPFISITNAPRDFDIYYSLR